MKIDIDLAKRLRDEGKTLEEIAKEFQCTPTAVHYALAKEPKLTPEKDPETPPETKDYEELFPQTKEKEGEETKPKPKGKKPKCPECAEDLDEDLICHQCGVKFNYE